MRVGTRETPPCRFQQPPASSHEPASECLGPPLTRNPTPLRQHPDSTWCEPPTFDASVKRELAHAQQLIVLGHHAVVPGLWAKADVHAVC